MFQGGRFRHRAQNLAAVTRRSRPRHRGCKAPVVLAVQRGQVHAAADERTAAHLDHRQRALDAVENTAQQAGAQFHRKRQPGAKHRRAGLHAGGFFIDLDGDDIAVQADDLAHQVLFAHLDQFQHAHLARPLGADHRSANPRHLPTCSLIAFLPSKDDKPVNAASSAAGPTGFPGCCHNADAHRKFLPSPRCLFPADVPSFSGTLSSVRYFFQYLRLSGISRPWSRLHVCSFGSQLRQASCSRRSAISS